MNYMNRALRLLLSCGLSCLSCTLAAAPLFVAAPPPSAMTRPTSVDALLALPSSADVRWLRVDPAVVDLPTRQLEFALGGHALRARWTHGERLPGGGLLWEGQLEGADLADATVTLVRSQAGITGSFHVDGVLYRLLPVRGQDHLLVQVDRSRLPPDHPPAGRAQQLRDPSQAVPANTPPASADEAVIRLLVTATDAAVAAYPGDMQALVQLAIAEANQSYRNSRLDMRLELAGYMTSRYAETGNMDEDLRRFQHPADGFMDEIHAHRDRLAADVGILVLDRGAACGIASEIGAAADTAFAVLQQQCMAGDFVLGHEIGHLHGARHDLRRDPARKPFAHGHGYWYQPPRTLGWRTVMSYDCPTGCRRVGYWSSPLLMHEGVPIGTAQDEDNRRVLDQARAIVAGFR